MTLQRFLNSVGESRWNRLGFARRKPLPTERFGYDRVVVMASCAGLLGTLVGGLLCLSLRLQPQMAGGMWPMVWGATYGLLAGTVAMVMVAVAWNRRARSLLAEGRTEPAELPPLRLWQRLFVEPFYALFFFVATPAVLWVAVDNALGTISWNQARASLVARGVPLTMEELQGPPPADADNFAMSPLIRASWDYQVGVTNGRSEPVWRDPVGRMRIQSLGVPQSFRPTKEGPGREKLLNDGRVHLDWIARSIRTASRPAPEGMPEELARRYGLTSQVAKGSAPASAAPALTEEQILALPVTDAAQEVLDYLCRLEPELAEIREAARRPRSRLGTHWYEGMALHLPYLSEMKSMTLTFRIRSAARLAKGDTEGAFDDLRTEFRLAEALAEEPVLLNLLVRIAQFAITTSSAWQGLVDHRWTEPQLVELQSLFSKSDFREALVRAFQGERIVSNSIYDGWLGQPLPPAPLMTPETAQDITGAGLPQMNHFWSPRGFFRRNQVNQHRMFDRILAQLSDPAWPRTVGAFEPRSERDPEFLARLGLSPTTPYNILPVMLAPAFGKAQGKAARMTVTSKMGETVCALERFRLRHGRYPERLAELAPAFIASEPIDPMNGKAFNYHTTEDGRFLLWSVGLNGRDDGGVVKDNDRQGDWVWPSPVPSKDLRLF